MKLLVKGAKIVTPEEILTADILTENGLIAKIAKNIKENSAKVVA